MKLFQKWQPVSASDGCYLVFRRLAGVYSRFAPVRAGSSSCILLSMQITLVHIGPRPTAKDGYETLVRAYLHRCSSFARCQPEAFRTEEALLAWLSRQAGRTLPATVLLDSRGRQMSSEALAAWLGARRDQGTQHIIFAAGPADGWTDEARTRAQLLLSLGPMTMAHSLARLVMTEQIYRAFTILTGHPYHSGH